MQGSPRNKRDGVTYFGPIDKLNNLIINDYIINIKKEQKFLRLFYIFYHRNTQKYYFVPVNNSKLDKYLIYLRTDNLVVHYIKQRIFYPKNSS